MTRNSTPSTPPRRPTLVWLLPALLIVAGLALLLAGQGRRGQPAAELHFEQAAAAEAPGTEPLATAHPTPASAPSAAAPTPAPLPTPDGYEAYCLWPGDVLGQIAHNAGVTEEAILAANPNWSGQAGSAIRLPPGSVPPSQWAAPLPPVTRVEDLPFGISGHYLGRDNRQKRVALSFDIGFAEGNLALKETLARRGIRATFFVLGGALVKHPYIIGQILNNDHELGNHSYTHDNMLFMDDSMIRWELATTEQLTQQAFPGATTKPLLRAPFGAIDERVTQIAYGEGYHIIGWTVDSRDWTDDITADIIYQRVVEHVCPGAIIAFHDVNPANAAALPRILAYLEGNGYQFVTVSEILAP